MAFTTLSDDEFYYGRRQLIDYNRTAQPTYGYEPLTQADFLDPQEHDTFTHGPRHAADVQRLYAIFRQHYRVNPLVAVFSGVKMRWRIADLPAPTPDIAVVPGAENWDNQRVELDMATEEVLPTLIVEVLSPRFVDADLIDKKAIYARAGVQEYWIVDSGERDDQNELNYRLLGYRLEEGTYQPIAPDEQGRLYSKVARLWLVVSADGQQVDAISKRSGEIIQPDPDSLINPATARAEATFRANSIASRLDFGLNLD